MFITADRLPVAFIDQSEISTGLIEISPAALWTSGHEFVFRPVRE